MNMNVRLIEIAATVVVITVIVAALTVHHARNQPARPDMAAPHDVFPPSAVSPPVSRPDPGPEMDAGTATADRLRKPDRASPSTGNDGDRSRASQSPGSHDGQGLAAWKGSGLSADELRFCDDQVLLTAMVLDRQVDLSLRNEALNGLRMNQVPGLTTLLRRIIDDPEFGVDYRVYAMQHLDLVMLGIQDQPGLVRQYLQKYLGTAYPDEIRREAMFGLLEVASTRAFGLSLLSARIVNGEGRVFGDLYHRALGDYGLEEDPQVIRSLDQMAKPGT